MMTQEEILAKIAEAEAKLHQVMTVGAIVEIAWEGRLQRYTEFDVNDLRGYINYLKSLLDPGTPGVTIPRRGPVFFYF